MNAITSIYIPRIETVFNAEFIADIFDRNGIAQVSRVYIEPYKSLIKNGLNKYNRVYIAIKTWHETEAAYNFVERLRNPTREARLVYSDDNWWPVEINNNTTKLASNKRVSTVFEEKQADFYEDDLSTTALASEEPEEFVQIDAEKTELLRNIIANFKLSTPILHEESAIHLYRTKALHKREQLLQDMDQSVDSFDGYLREMDDDRDKWFSEQYIYDILCM
jgi:hypothetical protein